MRNPITEPLQRLVDRWRTKQALSHLDDHLLEDIGREPRRSPYGTADPIRPGHLLLRRRK